MDALCQVHGAPFDATALGVVLEGALGRPAEVELDAALEALARGSDSAEHPGFEAGRTYDGNETAGWTRGACVPSALVHMARTRA